MKILCILLTVVRRELRVTYVGSHCVTVHKGNLSLAPEGRKKAFLNVPVPFMIDTVQHLALPYQCCTISLLTLQFTHYLKPEV